MIHAFTLTKTKFWNDRCIGTRINKNISKCSNVSEFQQLEEKKRQRYIKKFKEKGVSIRQISRLTGVTVGIVRKQ